MSKPTMAFLIVFLGMAISTSLMADADFRDPFQHPDRQPEAAAIAPALDQAVDLDVQAVFGQNATSERRRALVNGQVMVVGDLIGMFTLIDIDNRGTVHFRHQETGKVLRVNVHDGPT